MSASKLRMSCVLTLNEFIDLALKGALAEHLIIAALYQMLSVGHFDAF